MTKQEQKRLVKFLSLYLNESKKVINGVLSDVFKENNQTSTKIFWALRTRIDGDEKDFDLETIRNFKINNEIK